MKTMQNTLFQLGLSEIAAKYCLSSVSVWPVTLYFPNNIYNKLLKQIRMKGITLLTTIYSGLSSICQI